MATRVVVTGLGAIGAPGLGVEAFWKNLHRRRSVFAPLSSLGIQTKIPSGALVTKFEPSQYFAPDDLPLLDRVSQFAAVAAREAIADAGLLVGERHLVDGAVIIGTGCGGKHTDEDTYYTLYKERRPRAHPLTIPKGMPSAVASAISRDLKVRGPVFSLASACASGAHAIIQGYLMIKAGLVNLAIVGGSDAPFTYGLLKAWEALRVVSKDTCRPFSRDRSGMILGEGAGIVVLEAQRHAEERGARSYAELAGCGMSSDAGHITRPDIDGISLAITNALRDAATDPDTVDYVNAHGTGTVANDLTETQALHRVFGSHARNLAISSTKSVHGHALGAASALEFIATVLAISQNLAPPTANFTEPGEGCDLDYVPNNTRRLPIDVAISNAFAFGGLNAVTVIKS